MNMVEGDCKDESAVCQIGSDLIAVVFTLVVTVVPGSAEFYVGKVRSVERGKRFEDVPVAKRDRVKTLLRSPDIYTDHDRSTRRSGHGRFSLKCWGNRSKSGCDAASSV